MKAKNKAKEEKHVPTALALAVILLVSFFANILATGIFGIIEQKIRHPDDSYDIALMVENSGGSSYIEVYE